MAQAYNIDPQPPQHAPLSAHAAALTRWWFTVSPRTLEKWPYTPVKVNGKKQPATAEIWAIAAAHYPTTPSLERALAALPRDFVAEVRELIPTAREALGAELLDDNAA